MECRLHYARHHAACFSVCKNSDKICQLQANHRIISRQCLQYYCAECGLTGRKSLQLNKSSRRSPWHLLYAFSDLQCLSSYNCVSSYELSPYMCKSLKQNHCLFDRNNWKSMCVKHLLVKQEQRLIIKGRKTTVSRPAPFLSHCLC